MKRAFTIILLLTTGFHLWLAAWIPPAEDELYYWNWAQHLQWSYYDHPLMVAYLIRASLAVFGNTLFGIRFFACLIGSLSVWLVARFTKRETTLFYLVVTPIFFFGTILMTPDIPLVLFWALYLTWVIELAQALDAAPDKVRVQRWLLGGAALGLGILSKYTMVLAVPCTFALLALRYRPRLWWRGFAAHLALAFVVALPILVFNVQTDFAPIRFQWTHSMGHWELSWKFFGEYLGGQIALVGALPWILLPWVVWRRKQIWADPRLAACFCFFVFPFSFFALQAMRSRLEANWPLVGYLSLWPLAEFLLGRISPKKATALLVAAFLIPAICTGLIFFHLFLPLHWLPMESDRLARLKSQYEMIPQIARDLETMNPNHLPVFVSDYQWTSYFRFGGIAADQVFPGGRRSHFTTPGRDVCQEKSVLVFRSAWHTPEVLNCFPHSRDLKQYSVMVGGHEAVRFMLGEFSR